MKRADLVALQDKLMEEVVKRRRLGGYSADAAGIQLIAEILLQVVKHLIDKTPNKLITKLTPPRKK